MVMGDDGGGSIFWLEKLNPAMRWEWVNCQCQSRWKLLFDRRHPTSTVGHIFFYTYHFARTPFTWHVTAEPSSSSSRSGSSTSRRRHRHFVGRGSLTVAGWHKFFIGMYVHKWLSPVTSKLQSSYFQLSTFRNGKLTLFIYCFTCHKSNNRRPFRVQFSPEHMYNQAYVCRRFLKSEVLS